MYSITLKNRVSLYRCHQPYLSTLTLPCSALGGPPGSLASPLANTNPTGLHGFSSSSLSWPVAESKAELVGLDMP